MGCIFWDARSGGAWCAKFRDVNGKVRRFRFAGKTKTLARGELARLQVQVAECRQAGLASVDDHKDRRPPEPVAKGITLDKFQDTYLDHVRAHRSLNTRDRYEFSLVKWRRVFGARSLASITRSELQDFIDKAVSSGDSPATIEVDHAAMGALLQFALDRGEVTFNAMRGVKKPRVNNRRVRFLSEKEAEALFTLADPELRDVLRFLANTGLRDLECRSLTWSDVDLDRKVIRVNGKGSKNRHVNLNAIAAEILEHLPRSLTVGHVFRDPRTGKGYHKALSGFKAWTRSLERTGIKDFRVHDLRHHFASMMIQNGASLQVVSELLGHSNITMTSSRYAHLCDRNKAEAVAILERIGAQGGSQGKSGEEEKVTSAKSAILLRRTV